MLHRVSLWTRKGFEWSVSDTRIVGTVRAAELCAESMLRPHRITTTRYTYHRDVGRGAFCSVHRGPAYTILARPDIEPSVAIVPSVGEQGWTP